ncbi:MAG: glycine--tRNA ligase subunit beta [Nitrospirae bacterium]|nr:MAG: glycine--tRNA ligase subunit beta [Nitrospirota bacterium]
MELKNDTASMLLLEIGTEEIPARFLPLALDKLRSNAERMLSDKRLSFTSLKAYATPRRLCLIAEGVPSLQTAVEKEVWGPPVNVSFDANGNPTKAAEAFAKANNLSVDSLQRKEKGKGLYLVALVREDALPTETILPEVFYELILSINFPKSMRWGNGSIRFARPIHWILASYANKKVVFEVEGIKSSNMTKGHRFLSPASFEVKDTRSYINLLRNNFVIIDHDERKKTIMEESDVLTSAIGASVVKDDELMHHVSYLIEYPMPFLGTFPAEYLELPPELLITVMKGHQKYFAVNSGGKLTNRFIIVSNTKEDNAETIKRGAERVIKARFEDARFYYHDDKKASLKERLKELKKVTFHEKLGNLYEKTLRISSIAEYIADKCCADIKDEIRIAAQLSKSDLVSGVVREFPELQGVMGGYYAANDKLGPDVAQAIAGHYRPAFSGDTIPETDAGAVVSLADKLDNIASFFSIGLVPTATEDPFALRRQTLGIISILIGKRYRLDVSELFRKALQPYQSDRTASILEDMLKFYEQRLEVLLNQGYAADCVDAVTCFAKDEPLYTVKDRLEALKRFKTLPDYEGFLLSFKRINNIAPEGKSGPVKKELFSQEEEAALYNAAESAASKLYPLLALERYSDSLEVLLTLREPVNRFFDKVLVMDKNEDIKNNRLALIKYIQTVGRQLADFSKLS